MTDLTAQEQEHVRAALHFLRKRSGGWEPIGRALGFRIATLRHVAQEGRTVTASMAFRVSRLAGVVVEDVLTGKYPGPGTCPRCGHRPEQQTVAQ